MNPKRLYDWLLRPALDHACSLGPVMENRARLVPQAEGVVLEPGIGTGLNLPFYDPEKVKAVIGVDPSDAFLRLAKERAQEAKMPVEITQGTAERLPLEDNSVDTVLLTYTGCSIPDIDSALSEFRRVLKPSGRLLLCEHGRAPEPRVRLVQDMLNPVWKPLAGGCNLNRDIAKKLEEAGFSIERMENFYLLPRPKFATWHYFGSARPA